MTITTAILFDKQINLIFYSADGSKVDSINTPLQGIKPDISVTGNFLPSSMMNQIDVRIVNFYPDRPLSDFKFMQIEAGYSGSMATAIKGEVSTAYQEIPSPDGVTHFTMLMGSVTDVINIPFCKNYTTNTPVNSILRDAASAMKIELKTSILDSILFSIPFNTNGNVNDAIQKISAAKGLVIKVDGNYLTCYERGGTTQTTHDIIFFSGPPKKDAGKITFQGPWIPDLRTGDILNIDPKYMRESFGGAQMAFGALLGVLSYSFEFGTVGDLNQMTVTCLENV